MPARKRLGAELRRLRESSGQTQTTVAEQLNWSISKLSRLETGNGAVRLRDVRELIRFHRLDGTEEDKRLSELARAAQEQGWWKPFKTLEQLIPGLELLLAYEAEARDVLAYSTSFVPALLQTRAYADALLRGMIPEASPDEHAKLVDVTVRRPEIRRKMQPAASLCVVLDESVLRRAPGPPGVMAEQLDTIMGLLVDPGAVRLRILPSDAVPHRSTSASWQHFTFADERDASVSGVELPSGIQVIEIPEHAHRFVDWFEKLWERSRAEEETTSIIQSALRGLA
jgi:transcriptional regulator with XRE-family HTH domain